MATALAAVHDAAPQTGPPMPADATDPAAHAATVEEATAAQRDADTGALANPYVGDAIAAAAPDATPPDTVVHKATSDAATVTTSEASVRETWFDLLPPDSPEPDLDALLTRDDVLRDLRERGVDVGETTLVYWEKSGAVPRPVRRWRAGAPRSLYPPWAVPAVAQVRAFQEAGNPLPSIGGLVRAWARDPANRGERTGADGERTLALAEAVRAIAAEEYRRTGKPITGGELRLTDDDGRVRAVFRFAMAVTLAPDDPTTESTSGS